MQNKSNRPSQTLLALASVLIFGMTTIALTPSQKLPAVEFSAPVQSVVLPSLQEGAGLPQFSANAVYAVDLRSGAVLFSKNSNEPLLPASTTKIATALVSLAHYDLDRLLTVPELDIEEGKVMGLVEGEEISVRSLLYGLLVLSANDAAEVLAYYYPGGRSNFISAMNQLADSQSLQKTHFVNPTGFDEYLHFSTAEDLVKLTTYAIKDPTFSEIVAIPQATVFSQDGKIVHELVNVNELVGRVQGVLGVKTGWTINSGESLVTLVDRDGHKIMLSILGSNDRFGETEKLIGWIFENYSWE